MQSEYANPKELFIVEHWEKKSSAILGFVVIQSIILADKLADSVFLEKIKMLANFNKYIFTAHTAITLAAILFLFLIDKKVERKLKSNKALRSDIELRTTLVIKMVLTAVFGSIPIYLFFELT